MIMAADTYMKTSFGFKMGYFYEKNVGINKKKGRGLLNSFEYELGLEEQIFLSAERHDFDATSNWLIKEGPNKKTNKGS